MINLLEVHKIPLFHLIVTFTQNASVKYWCPAEIYGLKSIGGMENCRRVKYWTLCYMPHATYDYQQFRCYPQKEWTDPPHSRL